MSPVGVGGNEMTTWELDCIEHELASKSRSSFLMRRAMLGLRKGTTLGVVTARGP